MYRYEWVHQARQQIKKLSPDIQELIIKKLDFFITSPNPLSFSKRLKHFHAGQYRFRIGDYRVVFDVNGETLIILSLGHHRDIYV